MSTIASLETRRLRRPLAILGGLAFAVGLLAIVAPSAAAAIPIEVLVAVLGNDYVLVAISAVPAVLVVFVVLGTRVVTGLDQATPPDPETVHDVPSLGAEFDDLVSPGGLGWVLGSGQERVIREQLRTAAIATVVREANCTREEAQRLVDRGEWTDDATAADLLATPEGGAPLSVSSPDPGLVTRIRAALGGETPFQHAARRTASEIVRLDRETSR